VAAPAVSARPASAGVAREAEEARPRRAGRELLHTFGLLSNVASAQDAPSRTTKCAGRTRSCQPCLTFCRRAHRTARACKNSQTATAPATPTITARSQWPVIRNKKAKTTRTPASSPARRRKRPRAAALPPALTRSSPFRTSRVHLSTPGRRRPVKIRSRVHPSTVFCIASPVVLSLGGRRRRV
jgi:hypothetical protein